MGRFFTAGSLTAADAAARRRPSAHGERRPENKKAPGSLPRLFCFEISGYLFSFAFFSWNFFTISSCTLRGTAWYCANSIVNSPLPCVAERRSVE